MSTTNPGPDRFAPDQPHPAPSPTQPDQADPALHPVLRRLELISHLFDEAFRVPGTRIRLGWDSILGLIPVGGDALTTLVTGYYIWEARRLGARKRVLVKMLGNTLVDFLVGIIPVVGDLADIAWKSNRKNMRVLIRELQAQGKLKDDVSAERVSRLLGKQSSRRRSRGRAVSPWHRSPPLMLP